MPEAAALRARGCNPVCRRLQPITTAAHHGCSPSRLQPITAAAHHGCSPSRLQVPADLQLALGYFAIRNRAPAEAARGGLTVRDGFEAEQAHRMGTAWAPHGHRICTACTRFTCAACTHCRTACALTAAALSRPTDYWLRLH